MEAIKVRNVKALRQVARKIKNLVVVSDIHGGCGTALPPPGDDFPLIDKGSYRPSPMQLTIRDWWDEFWGEWVPNRTEGEPYAIAVNGECIDGVHHGSTTQISHNLADQKAIAVAILKPLVEKCGGLLYVLSGTPAHSGESGCDDEGVAKELGAIQDTRGRYARYELWKRVGKALVHLTHHIGTTGSQHYESTAVHKEMCEAFTEAGRWNNEPPDFVVRSHRHRHFMTRITTHKGMAESIVTPGWQGKTPFAYKIAGGRQSQPQFGGILIRQGDRDAYAVEKVWPLSRPEEE